LVYKEDLPRWLALGLALHRLKTSGDAAAWKDAVSSLEDSPQTLHRFVRLAGFLEEHYPHVFDQGAGFIAGSAVMLEFVQLHELSTDIASQQAQGVFSGETSVRQLRHILAETRERLANNTGAPPKNRSQRYADFSEQAVNLLIKHPELLDLGAFKSLEVTQVRSTLMPKLVAHTSDGEVAIDVRAPDVTASRTVAAAAAMFAARLAVLRLRFKRVILVIPANAVPYALETIKLLRSWAEDHQTFVDSFNFLLIEEDLSTRILK
jgi:hypothetical protein